ncbi:MAG TPA: hypothetical protein VKY65_07560 [Alphaproteobacteria bacterium]|nr:hypothetical protein [Alphaproteobacteria bacterium]
MLIASACCLAAALAIGVVLAAAYLRAEGRFPPLWLGAIHGAFALSGLGILGIALATTSPRGQATGSASFGAIAFVALAVAAAFGLRVFTAHLRRKHLPGTALGVHAMLAVTGFVFLFVYALQS